MLLTSSALSFACALTRFRTREFMPGFGNDGAGGDDGDGSADESTAADTSHAPQRTPVTRLTRVRLLIASLLLALIPSLWASYALLGIGSRYGSDMLTVVYAFGGVGQHHRIVCLHAALRKTRHARRVRHRGNRHGDFPCRRTGSRVCRGVRRMAHQQPRLWPAGAWRDRIATTAAERW